MNRKMIFLFATIMQLSVSGAAFGMGVPIGGTVDSTCTIVVTRFGTLVASPNMRVLNSRGAGEHGRATVTTNSPIFSLFVDQPTAFVSKPPEDTTPERDFRSRIRSTGATSFNWTQNSQALNIGQSDVRIDFRARKFNGDTFVDGNYKGNVVIRCE